MNTKIKGEWEIYDKNKQYTSIDNYIYDYGTFIRDYPSVQITKMAVYCSGVVILKVKQLDELRGLYRITNDVSDEDAIKIITSKYNADLDKPTTQERIAAALEALELINM